MRRVISTVVLWLVLTTPAALQERLQLPNKEGSVKFLVIGDSGTGGSAQREVASRIVEVRKIFPFEFAINTVVTSTVGIQISDFPELFAKQTS